MSGPIDELDDGRVVADMSEVVRPSLLLPRFESVRKRAPAEQEQGSGQPPVQLGRSERRAMIGGAVSAALAAGLVLFLALALLIVLLLKVWG